MVRKKVNQTNYQQSSSFQEQSYGNDTDVVSFPLLTACWKSHSNLSLESFTKRKILHFVTNSNWDDSCNARLPSRGWWIPRRVGSDPWYGDMIAYGAVAFSCRTLRFGFSIRSRIKNDSEQKTNCRSVDYLIKKKKIICSMKLALRRFWAGTTEQCIVC